MTKKNENITDYKKLKHTAYELVAIQGYTQKVAAERIGVAEKTVSEWAKEGGWRDIRKSRQSALGTANDNIRHIIQLISERRLEIEEEIHDAQKTGDKERELELCKIAKGLSDEISKQNKALQDNIAKGMTLGTYIDIMDDIFNNLIIYDEDLYNQTLDFQNYLVRKKTVELG